MGFIRHTTDDGRIPAIEELPCGAITPQIGMALVMTDGHLAAANGSIKPTYISVTQRSMACTAGEKIQVIRALPDTIFETTLAVVGADLKAGNKVTIHTDSMQVTATTANGVAEIVAMNGTAAGDNLLVRFA